MAKHLETVDPSPEPPRRTAGWGSARHRNVGDHGIRPAVVIALLLAFAGADAPAQEPARAPEQLSFYEVSLDDSELADAGLRQFLMANIPGLELIPERFDYERVIESLARPGDPDQQFLARTTPYVFVVARTLGAQLEVLATYRSRATDSTTYRSYFVVRREELADQSRPTRDDLEDYLRQKALAGDPARFIYHSKFSTSSYFVPSLFFRERGIYSITGPNSKMVAIHSMEVEGGSTGLVRKVANGDAELAAVWDGTKARIERDAELAAKVAFIELETVIPNDLLVASANLHPDLKKSIREALSGMTEEDLARFVAGEDPAQSLGDFRYWLDIDATDADGHAGAREARAALAGLCALTRQRPAPVIVQVETAEKDQQALREAARQAILLSGTELALYDPEIHKHVDLNWKLTPLHDEAVLLTSTIKGFKGLKPQKFRISHLAHNGSYKDLTQRIGDLIHSRLHRIRYLWPYQAAPTVIRDVAFDLPAGSPVKIERIRWLEPAGNSFEKGHAYDARVVASDYSTFRLEALEARNGLENSADPLSDVAYRVILLRPSEETWLLSLFTAIYVALMILATVFAAVELRRRTAATTAADNERPTLALVTG